MARSVPAAVYDQLVAEVERHPEGVGIEDLAAACPALARRTLQRHLARLAADGRIRAEGQAAARRYLTTVAPAVEAPVVEPSLDAAAWMSDAGREVQRLVRRPLMQRTPVGYRRSLEPTRARSSIGSSSTCRGPQAAWKETRIPGWTPRT